MIIFILGTKSEAIKFSSVIREVKRRKIPFKILSTNQHGDLTKLMKYLNLPKIDILFPKSPRERWAKQPKLIAFFMAGEWSVSTVFRMIKTFRKEKPKIVFYQGDTIAVPISAIASKLSFIGIKTAHREAGMRTHNLFDPFPEELCRVIGDRFTDILFTPTPTANINLWNEKVKGDIHYVKDCAPEILEFSLKKFRDYKKTKFKNYIIVHIHHQENINSRERMEKLVKIINNCPFNVLYPMTIQTKKNFERFDLLEKLGKNVIITEPFEYQTFPSVIRKAKAVLSDSGGMQEECCILKVPYIAMRGTDLTEWKETIDSGSGIVSQFDVNGATEILKNLDRYFPDIKNIRNPLGDGLATKRIVDILETYL